MATAQLAPLPMFGVHNEHWKNHPAGLPVSQYKPNTNPNTGAESVDNAWAAYQAQQTPAPDAEGATPPTPWNQWYEDMWAGQSAPEPGTAAVPSTGASPDGSTPVTGFAARYTPAMMDQIYENPWYILQDVFSGSSTSSPLYQALRDFGGDPLTLFNIAQGMGGSVSGGAEEFINWLADTYGQQGTVGGSRFSAPELLGALFGQQKFGAESENTLGQILGAGDMSTQVRTLYNMARDASNVGMNPLAARGYQAALAQAGDAYGRHMLSDSGTDGPQNPSAWIAANMPWLGMGGS